MSDISAATFDFRYYLPVINMDNIFVMSKSANDSNHFGYMLKRPIFQMINDTAPIGEANYVVNIYSVDMNNVRTSGKMKGVFSAQHIFKRLTDEYVVFFDGQVEWNISSLTQMDINNPHKYITNLCDLDTIVANSLLKNNKKYNYGEINVDISCVGRASSSNGGSTYTVYGIVRDSRNRVIVHNLKTEIDARIAGDNALSDRIADEVNARLAGDNALGVRITAEETARTNADNALGTRIDNEITDRTNADNALGTRIDNEITDRIAGDNALISRVSTIEGLSLNSRLTTIEARIAEFKTKIEMLWPYARVGESAPSWENF